MRYQRYLAGSAAIVLCVGLTGCDDRPGDRPAERTADRFETVHIWVSRGEQPVAVERQVRGAPLEAALRALVAGPTAAERVAGLTSWFSEETSDALRRVRVEGTHAEVDFRDLPALIPGATSSAGSEQLLMALDSTVFQFDRIESVEYRLDGSCDAFSEWLQRSCEIRSRE